MWSITITLGQLLIAILIFFILRKKIEPNSITVTTEEDMTHKNLLPSRSYYIDTKYDKWSKFSEHFISLSEYRKRKLNKINTIKDNLNLYIKHKCDDIQ